ncbi:hypothetical protein [Peribacillus sp. NPDC060253]
MYNKQNPWAYAQPMKKDQPVKIKKDCGCNNNNNNNNKNKGY